MQPLSFSFLLTSFPLAAIFCSVVRTARVYAFPGWPRRSEIPRSSVFYPPLCPLGRWKSLDVVLFLPNPLSLALGLLSLPRVPLIWPFLFSRCIFSGLGSFGGMNPSSFRDFNTWCYLYRSTTDHMSQCFFFRLTLCANGCYLLPPSLDSRLLFILRAFTPLLDSASRLLC